MKEKLNWSINNISDFLQGIKTGKIRPSSCNHKKTNKGYFTFFNFAGYQCDIHIHWIDKDREIFSVAHIKDLRTNDPRKQYPSKIVDTHTIAMLRYFSGLDEKQNSNVAKDKFKNTKIRTKKNHTIINKKHSIMSNVQSYHLQLEQLEQLKNYLNHFKIELLERSLEYQRKVDMLFENGLPVETYNKFQSEHLDMTKSNIQSIVNLIETHSIPFIISNIELTIAQIERNS